MLKCNLFVIKAVFSASLLQYSVSHDLQKLVMLLFAQNEQYLYLFNPLEMIFCVSHRIEAETRFHPSRGVFNHVTDVCISHALHLKPFIRFSNAAEAHGNASM